MHNAEFVDQLARVRMLMRPYWSPSEAGGILLLGDHDEEENAKKFLELMSCFPDINPNDEGAWTDLSFNVSKIAFRFIKEGQLAPGAYTIDNYYRTVSENGRLPLNQWGNATIDVPQEASFSFQVSSDHLKIIRRMNTREYDNYVELMDCKRPYGDMTYFYYDMAEALELSVPSGDESEGRYPPEWERRFELLHSEMLFAVQAFWKHASLDASEPDAAA